MQHSGQQGQASVFREDIPEIDGREHSIDQTDFTRTHPPLYQKWPGTDRPHSPQSDTISSLAPSGSNPGSKKHRPMSPELLSPGLESIWSGEGDKEVYHGRPIAPDASEQRAPPAQKASRICGMRKRNFYILFALALPLIIGLGVGLGVGLSVGLGTKHNSNKTPSSSPAAASTTTAAPIASATVSSDYYFGGALNPAYYSTTGAFNGSGIALAAQSYEGVGGYGELTIYFQHHSGQIRYSSLLEGIWQGGSTSEIVAVDAKNSTPLSVVAETINGSILWHVFYIDNKNRIRQRSNSNTTNTWTDGLINQLDLVALDADQVGMQACWYGKDYGDSDYAHVPLPTDGDTSNSTVDDYNQFGMHLWYASDSQTFKQLGWRYGDVNWTHQETWTEKNGHAGVGCYSWEPNSTVTYVMMVNLENNVEFWWKDTNTSLPTNKSHPINVWTNTSISIPGVQPSTSLGYTNVFYAQMDGSNSIMGYNISWNAESTSIITADTFTVEVQDASPGLPGTHLSVSELPTSSGGNNLLVFYQTEGNDITEFQRDLDQGQWTEAELTIPTS